MKFSHGFPVFLYLIILSTLVCACGKRQLQPGQAQKLISGAATTVLQEEDPLRKEDVEVVRVINSSGSEAVVESRLTAAFRMERTDQKWQVREVRLGRGRWEQISTLEKALGQIKIEATEEMLDRIAAAVLAYRKANAHLPQINDYVALSDLLTPGYLTPLIRLDAWNRPFYATVTSAGTVTIRSAGPDGRIDTEDDIQKTL